MSMILRLLVTYHIVLRQPPCVSYLNPSAVVQRCVSDLIMRVPFPSARMLTGAIVESTEAVLDTSPVFSEKGEIGSGDVGRGGRPLTASSINGSCTGRGGGN